MKGRKPKPTFLKVVNGNPGRRPLNLNEPKPHGDLLDAPAWMTPSQHEGWRYAIEHSPPGLLKLVDRAMLAIWVVAEDLHRTAAQTIATDGLFITTPDRESKTGKLLPGCVVQAPCIAILNRQAQIMMRAAAELGFSPTARVRISVAPEIPPNRFSEFAQ